MTRKNFLSALLLAAMVLCPPKSRAQVTRTSPRYNIGVIAERLRKTGIEGEALRVLQQLVQSKSAEADELADTLAAIAIAGGKDNETTIGWAQHAEMVLARATGYPYQTKAWYPRSFDLLMTIAEKAEPGVRAGAIHVLARNTDSTFALADLKRIVTSQNSAASVAASILWSRMGATGIATLRAAAEQNSVVEPRALEMVRDLASVGWKHDPK